MDPALVADHICLFVPRASATSWPQMTKISKSAFGKYLVCQSCTSPNTGKLKLHTCVVTQPSVLDTVLSLCASFQGVFLCQSDPVKKLLRKSKSARWTKWPTCLCWEERRHLMRKTDLRERRCLKEVFEGKKLNEKKTWCFNWDKWTCQENCLAGTGVRKESSCRI